MRPIRTLLFAPANRPDLVEKFLRYPADGFVIDLEDGTPEAAKADARRDLPRLVQALRDRGLQGEIIVRSNSVRSAHAKADLSAATAASVDGIMVPKVETVADLQFFAESALPIIGLIETPRGVLNVETLVAGGESQLQVLAFGAEDFITDLGGRRTPDGLEVLYARSRIVLAAKAAGLQALDQVFVNIRDDDAFRRDAELGRQLGYDGKMCIVPRQVEIANSIFSPTDAEIERSRRIVEAYESAKAAGRGTIEFEGVMIDEPLLKRARSILKIRV